MNNINITTEMCAEDRARIDRLIAALESLVNDMEPPVVALAGTPFQTEQPAEIVLDILKEGTGVARGTIAEEELLTPAEPETAPEEVGEPADEPEEKEVPEHTKAELQQKVISIVTAGKKDEVKAIIEQYAERVSAIPDEKINEVWDKLTKLEG